MNLEIKYYNKQVIIMILNKKVSAIILAAGSSTRYGKNRNKNFDEINGKTVIAYSIDVFNKSKYVDDIIIVYKENEIDYVKNIINDIKHKKKITLVVGGKTRKESVYNGLIKTLSDIVIIHDAARPLIKEEYIVNLLNECSNYLASTIGVKAKDTIKITDHNNIVLNTTIRDNTWLIQTPQCFDRRKLLYLHEKYKNEDVTDDCVLFEKDNISVKIVNGDYKNIKITTYEDLDITKCFLENK